MPAADRPVDEPERLAALRALAILDTPAEDRFDRVTRLAAHLFDVPIALVSLVDSERQWFKSCVGLPTAETDRSVSFCAHAVLQADVFVVEDPVTDARFADNTMVTGEPHVRFYAGVPLQADGQRVGTLCIIDRRSRTFSTTDRGLLRDLASIVERELASSELSRTTEELVTSQSHIAGILSAAGDGIIGLDPNGRVSFANPAACALLRADVDDLVGAHLHDTAHRLADGSPFPWTDCPTHRTLHDGTPGRVTNETFIRADSTHFSVEFTATAVHTGDRITGAVLVFQDISRRREVDALKDEFVSIVSHELRTPLTSIRGSLGLLASGALGPIDPRGQRMIEIAVESTDRLVRLVNDILDLERLRSGRSAFTPSAVQLASLMLAAGRQVEPAAKAAAIDIVITPVELQMDLDEDRILQVLTNLIGNAIKFSASGGGVELTGTVCSDEVILVVSDHGRGIPTDALNRIFEPFEQVDASDARAKGGTGLGLAISRGIVERHGGRIWAESTWGHGARFSVALPITASPVEST